MEGLIGRSKVMVELHETVRRVASSYATVLIRGPSGTGEDLETAVNEGRFREDLVLPLDGLPINLPAQRDRGDDVILIANHYLREFAGLPGTGVRQLTDNTRALLRGYS